jgi:hypothetical protein
LAVAAYALPRISAPQPDDRPSKQYIFYKQSVDIFRDAFVHRLIVGYTIPDIGKGFLMIDTLVDFPKLLAADGNPVLQQRFGLNQRQCIPLNGGEVVSVFHIEAALEAFKRSFREPVINPSQLLFFLDKTGILHDRAPLSSQHQYFGQRIRRLIPVWVTAWVSAKNQPNP